MELVYTRRAHNLNGYSEILPEKDRPFNTTHGRKYSEAEVVKFYRPRIYLHENQREPVKQKQRHRNSSSDDDEGIRNI